jgi:hypothetical protein
VQGYVFAFPWAFLPKIAEHFAVDVNVKSPGRCIDKRGNSLDKVVIEC